MSNEELTQRNMADIVERVVIEGDLAQLSAQERVDYYRRTCESLGLNPLTKPFDYIRLNGKLTLYVKRDATDQLRKRDRVSIMIVSREKVDDLYIVHARATTPDGRTDEAIGAVSIVGLGGDALANAIMKAETKAKRRVTLSIVGLGWLDETEIDTVPGAQPVNVDDATGEIAAPAPAPALPPTANPSPAGWAAWSDRAKKAFWARCSDLNLSREEVLAVFGVSDMAEYGGTMEHAATILKILEYGVAHGLALGEVCAALGVDVLDTYTGNVQQAISDINRCL